MKKDTKHKGITGSNGVYIYKNIEDCLNVMKELEKQYNNKFKGGFNEWNHF